MSYNLTNKRASQSNYTVGRGGKSIQYHTIHWWNSPEARPSYDSVIKLFQNPARQASAHFIVTSGNVNNSVPIDSTAWTNGNFASNQVAITYECDPLCRQSDLETLAELIADTEIKHLGGKSLPINGHRDFKATACPGTYYTKLNQIRSLADKYKAQKQGKTQSTTTNTTTTTTTTNKTVKVTADALNIRSGPGTNYKITGVIRDKGVYTIVSQSGSWGKLKSGKGWIHLGYTTSVTTKATTTSKKSNEAIAKEVIAGKWGNGQTRVSKLSAAGYNPSTIQSLVNSMLSNTTPKKSNEAIAKEVIAGKWGNGQTRVSKLSAAGYNPSTIQSLVNSML